jgi:hypothetical protein
MKNTPITAEQMADNLMNCGMKCYCVARQWLVLWIPSAEKVIDLGDTQKIKRFFGITDIKYTHAFQDYCGLACKPLLIPYRIERTNPMPLPMCGERHPRTKDMMKWAQTILKQINKQ